MSYTEVPTDLLSDAAAFFLNTAKPSFDRAGHSADVTVTVAREQMEALEPLTKWLEYIVLVWNVKRIDV